MDGRSTKGIWRPILIYSDYAQTIKGLLDRQSEFVGAMDMDWKDREKSQDQDS